MVDHHKLESLAKIVYRCVQCVVDSETFFCDAVLLLLFCCTFSVGLFSLLIVSFLGGLYIFSDCFFPWQVIYIYINMPDPTRICWEALARSGPGDYCSPACFRTGSVWPKPDTVSQN